MTNQQLSSRNSPSVIGWCFTLNNPEGQLLPSEMPGLRYIVWQEERGQSGTHHYQGYLELIKKRKRGGVCQLIPRAHFEPRKGTR
jgi:Putative viral replication protein